MVTGHIFLSYSREDIDLMIPVRQGLESLIETKTGQEISPSTSWSIEIESALSSAQLLVVILSENTKHSEWVKRAIKQAAEQGLRIIPVLASGSQEDAIPPDLQSYPYLDLRDHHNYEIAFGRLISLIEQFITPQIPDLSDNEILELANLMMEKDKADKLSRLLERQDQTNFTDEDEAILDELIFHYEKTLLRRSEALREAVKRGLIPPLDS